MEARPRIPLPFFLSHSSYLREPSQLLTIYNPGNKTLPRVTFSPPKCRLPRWSGPLQTSSLNPAEPPFPHPLGPRLLTKFDTEESEQQQA